MPTIRSSYTPIDSDDNFVTNLLLRNGFSNPYQETHTPVFGGAGTRSNSGTSTTSMTASATTTSTTSLSQAKQKEGLILAPNHPQPTNQRTRTSTTSTMMSLGGALTLPPRHRLVPQEVANSICTSRSDQIIDHILDSQFMGTGDGGGCVTATSASPRTNVSSSSSSCWHGTKIRRTSTDPRGNYYYYPPPNYYYYGHRTRGEQQQEQQQQQQRVVVTTGGPGLQSQRQQVVVRRETGEKLLYNKNPYHEDSLMGTITREFLSSPPSRSEARTLTSYAAGTTLRRQEPSDSPPSRSTIALERNNGGIVEHYERRANENIMTASRPSSGSNDAPYRNCQEKEKGTTPTSSTTSEATTSTSLSSTTTSTAAAATISSLSSSTTRAFFPEEVSTIISYLLTFYHLPSYSYSHRNYTSTPKVMIVLSSRPTLISIVLTHELFVYLFTNLSDS